MDYWLTDEMRGRAVEFWSRGVLEVWPVEAHGHVFLGKAVLAAGEVLFGEKWTGREPWQWQLPTLDGSRSYSSDGFDAVYAISLLGEHMPELGIGPVLTWSLYEKPLTAEQWHLAFDIYKTRVAHDNYSAAQRMTTVARAIIEAAASEDVVTVTRSSSGEYIKIPARKWNSEIAFARFQECQMDPKQPDIIRTPGLFDRGDVPLLPNNEWIFVEGKSFDGWLGRQSFASHPLSADQKTRSPSTSDPSLQKAVPLMELKKCLGRAERFMKQNGYLALTKQEAEWLLESIFPTSVRNRRREAAATIAARSKRRTQRELGNRSKELEDCRQFLLAAT